MKTATQADNKMFRFLHKITTWEMVSKTNIGRLLKLLKTMEFFESKLNHLSSVASDIAETIIEPPNVSHQQRKN